VAKNCRFLDRGFNDTYLVGIGKEWYIFRVYLSHKYYIESTDSFQFELDLLDHLDASGIPVASAKRRINNETLGLTSTPLGERAFALFSYAMGDQVSMRTLNSERCIQLGKVMAELHLAANEFQTNLNRYYLDRKFLVDEPLKIIAQQHDKETRVVDHPGNIHYDGDELTLFDFDHCAYGWRAYELALTEFIPEAKKIELLKGYESIRPLSQGEKESIPVFAKLRRLWDIGDSLAVKPIRAQS